jgi:glycosyltransferase involved in cell wall biosynthesis
MSENGFRKVLMIAYYFPPMGLSGVQRTAKFAKYLMKYGWKPTVLTVEPSGYFAFDDSLLKEIEDAGVTIVRTGSKDINHLFKKRKIVPMPSERLRKLLQFFGDLFFLPDTKRGWKSTAVEKASELLESEHFDILFATAPPQTDFLIGVNLKKKFNIPLVVDYRDAWLDNPFKYFSTPLHTFLHKRMERKVLRAADRVLVTHRRVKESILRRFRFVDYNEVIILSQGFDPEDFLPAAGERRHSRMKMKIAHAGTFYGGRNPNVFLQALSNVLRDNPKMRGRFEVNFLGNAREEDIQFINRLELQGVVNCTGYVPHRECVRQIFEADVLWFIMDNDYQTAGKLYEYFGARKPMIASIVEGYTKQLIGESKAAVCVATKDLSGHEEAIMDYFKRFEQKKLPRIPEEFAARFNRVLLTRELAKQFESLMDYDRAGFVKVRGDKE